MRVQDAIEILKELWRYSKTTKYTDDEIRKALEIAITVLGIINTFQGVYTWTDGSKGDKESDNNENN